MTVTRAPYKVLKSKIVRLALVIIITMITASLSAQEFPPRPIEVTTSQALSFGAFTLGATGGTVTVTPGSIRTSSGDIILLNLGLTYTSALFEITANPGTVISILNGPDEVLPGSNGGSITLTIGDSDPVSPFVTEAEPPLTTPVSIGGILTVGNILANPAGDYSGTFSITFNQE
ncbi:MAG: DUF4402 domain-containing protein [Bacteroidales bacterium]|nr:DUF4402 domain-containing protein [Bacteroidales bacterium]